MEYPWYGVVDSKQNLAQGDFIARCPVVIPPSDLVLEPPKEEGKSQGKVDVRVYDVVVMTQSCDLLYQKVDSVVVCPVWPYSVFSKDSPFFAGRDGKKALIEGNSPGYHLLEKCEIEGFKREHAVVDFRHVYGVPFPRLSEYAGRTDKRLRLLPPYREHLSQAFARFFMMVGLPSEVRLP
jgi:hypothetical protein